MLRVFNWTGFDSVLLRFLNSFNTFAATNVLTLRSLKLLTTPGTFKHVVYIAISAFDVTLFFCYNWPGGELIKCSH